MHNIIAVSYIKLSKADIVILYLFQNNNNEQTKKYAIRSYRSVMLYCIINSCIVNVVIKMSELSSFKFVTHM